MADAVNSLNKTEKNICKRCNKTALSGVRCVKCSKISHTSCVNVLKLQVSSDGTTNCCESNNNVDSDDLEVSFKECEDNTEIFYLKAHMKQKDELILNQKSTIDFLKQQVEVLNKLLINNSTCSKSLPSSETTKTKNNKHLKRQKNTELPVEKSNNNNVASNHIDNNTCEENGDIVNISAKPNDDTLTIDGNKDKSNITNNKKSSRRTAPIKGSRKLNDDTVIRPSQKLAFIHVYKLHPDTTETELEKFLLPDFPEVQCEKLNSLYAKYYSSFKVTVNDTNREAVMDPTFWPEGTSINKFFHSRKKPIKNI